MQIFGGDYCDSRASSAFLRPFHASKMRNRIFHDSGFFAIFGYVDFPIIKKVQDDLFGNMYTLHNVWKSTKKSHLKLRAKRATFTFWVDKSWLKCQKWSILTRFWKPEACGQTVLPDRSVLIVQKLVEKAKIQKFKCDVLSNF